MTANPATRTDDPGMLKRQVGSAIRWSALNSVLQRVSQVGVGIVLARLVAPEQFGVFAVALVVMNIVLSVGEMGVSVALVRTSGPIAAIAPTVTTLCLASGTALALVCIVGAPWFSDAMGAPEATGVIQLMSFALVIAGASAVPGALLQRNLRQDHRMAADTAGFVVGTAVAVVLALLGFGAWSLAWSRVATNAVAAAVIFALVKERYRPGFNRAHARSLLAFGLPLAGSSLLVLAVLNVDYIVVGKLLGTEALGFYLLAFNLSSWPVGAFSVPIRSVSLAAFSKVRDDRERFIRSFPRALRLLAVFTLPACVLLAALGEPLIRLIYGDRWAPAAAALGLLVLLGGMRVALELAYDCLASAGRSRAILYIHLAWLIALVPMLAIGAWWDGIRGVAGGHVAVALLVIAPAYLFALRREGIRAVSLAGALARPALGGAVMVAVAMAVQRLVPGALWQLVIGTVLGLIGYVAVLYPMRAEVIGTLRRTAA